MKSSLFCPGTHLVQFHLTSSYESSFISFCFLSLDISIGVRLPCPWSKPISHSLDVYQCLITEPLAVFDNRIYSFRLLCPWFLRCLFYTYSGSTSFHLLSTCGLKPASALRTCTLNTLLWVELSFVSSPRVKIQFVLPWYSFLESFDLLVLSSRVLSRLMSFLGYLSVFDY